MLKFLEISDLALCRRILEISRNFATKLYENLLTKVSHFVENRDRKIQLPLIEGSVSCTYFCWKSTYTLSRVYIVGTSKIVGRFYRIDIPMLCAGS